MKHELSIEKPKGLKDLFPGQFTVFSWLDSAVTVPTLITLITTRKPNGRANACLHAWGMLVGGHGNYSSMIAVAKRGHTYANIMREKEWCICIPPWRLRQQCFATIQCNQEENDEISDAGFTMEKAVMVKAPRIAECPICLECQYAWDHELAAQDGNHIFVGKVVHAAMDDSVMLTDIAAKLERMELMCSVPVALNPLTAELSSNMGFARFALWDEGHS
jgi:flavin reductase (DIM6/NTAB) family NADH-FMN oxidoreductase RutF